MGRLEGVPVPESAGNAVICGILITSLRLAVPGDPAAGVIFGRYLVHGRIPGQMLFQQSAADVQMICSVRRIT